MRISRLWITILLIAISAEPLIGQNIIKGTVKNAKTGTPIADVNVYLANTTVGTTTNSDGKYKFKNPVKGISKIVFSFVGFKPKVYRIQFKPHQTNTLNVSLKPQTLHLKEVHVTASNKKWEQNLKRFKKYFLGETDFAKNTTIQNPQVLRFSRTHHTLTAKSTKAIIVVNKSLGYKIRILLDQFKWKNNYNGFYRIFPRFKKLSPKDKKQLKRWQKNREKAYKNSLSYFFKKLYNHQIKLYHYGIKPYGSLQHLNEQKTDSLLAQKSSVNSAIANNFRGFKLTQSVQVTIKNKYSASYYEKYSALSPNTSNNVFFVDNNGNLLDPLSIKIAGYWASLRISDKLPLNYH